MRRSAAGLLGPGSGQHVHQIARGLTVFLAFKRDIEIGRIAQHQQQRPQRKAGAAFLLHPEIDPHPLNPCRQRGGRDGGKITGAEIALEEVCHVHAPSLSQAHAVASLVGKACTSRAWALHGPSGGLAVHKLRGQDEERCDRIGVQGHSRVGLDPASLDLDSVSDAIERAQLVFHGKHFYAIGSTQTATFAICVMRREG